MTDRRADIVDLLRRRVLRGLQAGALRLGDRLPSARELERELRVDHRVILAAYRKLVAEGLVELRPRGGIYVAAHGDAGAVPAPAEPWIVEILTQGVAREIPVTELHEWLRRSVETLRLRAAAIQATPDQLAGLCRELHDDYGLEAHSVDVAALRGRGGDLPIEIRHADLLVTTEAHRDVATAVAERLGKELIVAEVRPDLIGAEWRMLLRHPVYVIVGDHRFIDTVRRYFAGTPGAENLRFLVAGHDDPMTIPDDAPTYVTRSARERLGDAPIKGRILPAARVLSTGSAREIIGFIVRRNLDVLTARRRQ